MSQTQFSNPVIDPLRAQVSKMLDGLDPEMPIGATVVFKVDPARESTFRRNADVLTAETRKLPGLVDFVYLKHLPISEYGQDHTQYAITEHWESVRLFRAQWDSQHIKHFQYSVLELLKGPPNLIWFDASDDAHAPAPVRKTGQTRCWDGRGNVIDCAGSGQDAAFMAGVTSPEPRFHDNGDGTVTDNLTNLIWLKNANPFNEVPWEEALARCGGLMSGMYGLTDGSTKGQWRLPNVNELQSLMHLDNSDGGAALPPWHPFTNADPHNYWSSTTVAFAPVLGWYVATAVGPPVFDLKFNPMRAWPVRGTNTRVAKTGQKTCYDSFGQPIPCGGTGQDGEIQAGVKWPVPRFTDNQDGTVTDKLTGLIWLKNANAFGTKNWEDALRCCNTLASGSHGLADGSTPGTWRLPNLKELRSVMDYENFAPALPTGHPFLYVRRSLYWSSTSIATAPNQARFVFVGLGPNVWERKTVEFGVWPIKGGL